MILPGVSAVGEMTDSDRQEL